MSSSPSKGTQEAPLTIPILLNSLHTHLQIQTQLLPTFHAQLGLPPSAIADELQALQSRLTETVEAQVQIRRSEVDEWMRKCDDIERECSRYSRALGGHMKSIGATLGELRKQQVLPVRFEMISQFRDKVEQLYKAKLEQQTNYINRIVTLSRTLGSSFFSDEMLEPIAAQGEDPSDNLSLRDVTPERFTKLDKEYYRGKAEISNRFRQMTEAFKRLDELYAILGMEPSSVDSPTSSSLSLCPPNLLSLSVSSADPFMSSISSVSTPTPVARQSKISPISLFPTSDSTVDFQQIFCRYVQDLDQKDPNGTMSDEERSKLLEGIEPSHSLLQWANQKIKELEAIEVQRQTQIEALCDQLIALWKRLDVTLEDMEDFMEHHKGVTEECVRAYEDELIRMMEEKRRRMKEFVENARKEIDALWDELLISEAERLEFAPFSDMEFTEDLLNIHEEEIKRLKMELGLKEALLSKIKKYFEFCDEKKKLEQSALDQGRLVTAVGKDGKRDVGRLLREEKMRKHVQKDLPKLVEDLFRRLPAWEADQDRPFLVNGTRILDVLLEAEDGKENANAKKPRAGSVPRARTPGPSTTSTKPPSAGSDTLTHSVPNKRPRLASSSNRPNVNMTSHEPLPHRVPFSSRSGITNVTSPIEVGPGSVTKHGRTPSSSLPRPKSVTKMAPTSIPQAQRAGYGHPIGLGYPSSTMRPHAIDTARSVSHSSVMPAGRSARNQRRESFKPRPSIDSMSVVSHKERRYVSSNYGACVKEEDEE